MRKRTWSSAAARRILHLGKTDDIGSAVRAVTQDLLDGVSCPPTDLKAVADRLGVRIECDEITGSGELHRTSTGLVAKYASGQGRGRRRFTIAHELAHAVIYATGPRAPRTGRELERLCDMIAVELLMPEPVFAARLGPEFASLDVFALASEFQTSLTATAIRCTEVLPITACEVEDTNIIWRRGSLDAAALTEPCLQHLMECACDGTAGSDVLYLNDRGDFRWFHVKYHPIGTTGRAIIFLSRTRRPSSNGQAAS